jgi:hypothetical protein
MPSLVGLGVVTAFVLIAGSIALVSRERSSDAKEKPAAVPTETLKADPAPPRLSAAESLEMVKAIQQQIAKSFAAAKPATPTTPTPATIDSATIAQIRAEAIKTVLDSIQKLEPPAPAPGGRGQGSGGGPRNGRGYTMMTRAQLDSFARAAAGASGRGDFTNFVPPNINIPIPPPGTSDRAAMDERAANMGPARRIIIADPPLDKRYPDEQAAGVQLMDSLRKHLMPVTRFLVVNHDSVNAELAKTRNRDEVMKALNSEVNVSLRPLPTKSRDSVSWMMSLYDVTSRTRSQVVTLGPVPLAASQTIADSLTKLAMRALFQLDHQPRRADAVPKPDHP